MKLDELIDRPVLHSDDRGWVYEILRGIQAAGAGRGQIFVTAAHPGRAKGRHFHRRKTEWFCVVSGSGEMLLRDVDSGESATVPMRAGDPLVLKVVPGLAHMLRNTSHDPLVAIVYVNEEFNPDDTDTFPFDFS